MVINAAATQLARRPLADFLANPRLWRSMIHRDDRAAVLTFSESLALQSAFTTDRFRVYTNRDLLGVELAGALKNVVAIAAGISAGSRRRTS